MKIALLLSGLPRQWHPSLITQINMLAPYNVGIFFHFWDTIASAEKEQILKRTQPVAYTFEAPRDFSSFDTDPHIKPDNINIPSRIASQLYSWKQVGELFAPYCGDYDCAIRSRADLHFVQSINSYLPLLRPNDIVIPWWIEGRFLSDIFAFGDCRMILHYHRLFDNLGACAQNQSFTTEVLLMKHMQLAEPQPRIVTEANQQWFFVRRAHMANMALEDCMKEQPGRSKWFDPEIVKSHQDFHARLRGDEGKAYVDKFVADSKNMV